MAHNTPFLPGYDLRLSYSAIEEMCRDFGIESVDDLPKMLAKGELGTLKILKIIWFGLKTKHPKITFEELRQPGGMFEKFMDVDGTKGLDDLTQVGIQILFDSGVLAKGSEPVVDKGEVNPSQ